MEWSKLMKFLVGMEHMTYSGIGTTDADLHSSFYLFNLALVRCLMDRLSIDSKLSTVMVSWSVTRW